MVQKLGSSVTLRCEARPHNVSLSWRLNGRELAEADLQLLGAWLRPGGFYIQTLSERALGRYQCVASSSLGAVASVPANVTAASECSAQCTPSHPLTQNALHTLCIIVP